MPVTDDLPNAQGYYWIRTRHPKDDGWHIVKLEVNHLRERSLWFVGCEEPDPLAAFRGSRFVGPIPPPID